MYHKLNAVSGGLPSKFTIYEMPYTQYGAVYEMQMWKCISLLIMHYGRSVLSRVQRKCAKIILD